MIIFGSFLPSLGLVGTTKSTQVEGADIVMKSCGIRRAKASWADGQFGDYTGVKGRGKQVTLALFAFLKFTGFAHSSIEMRSSSLNFNFLLPESPLVVECQPVSYPAP
jgi:hypothetical protein